MKRVLSFLKKNFKLFLREEMDELHSEEDDDRYKQWKPDHLRPSLDDSLLHDSLDHTSVVSLFEDCIIMVKKVALLQPF